MPSPYQSIVFDFGGVLISPITHHIADVAASRGVTMEALLEVLIGPREQSTSDHPWHRAERGELAVADLPELVAPIAAAAGIDLVGDEFELILGGEFTARPVIVERVARLRDQGYSLALLTNSFKEYRAFLESRIDVSLFDHVVDSSEVGCRKPEREIYDLTARLLGSRPEQILYLDDFAGNVDGAIAAGWHAFQVTSEEQALAELEHRLG